MNPSSTKTESISASTLRDELQTIVSLTNLKIIPFLDDDSAKIDYRRAKQTDDGMAFFARGIVRRIEFNLYIPFRIQNDSALPWREYDIGTENFRVHVLYAYYSPVVFVELLDPKEPHIPSGALAVLRKYLQSECQKTRDLTFTYVGPTPFHANFRVEPGPVQNDVSTFECAAQNTRGYSRITFYYRASSFENAQAAFERLMNEIDDELNIYYAIRNQDSTTYSSWDDIERLFSEIVSSSEHTTWWQHIRTLRSRGRSVQELSIALARFQVQQITDDSFTERIHYEAYERGTPSYLKEYIEAGMKERPSFPTGPVADLLGFLERRRSKGLELLVILAAAIIGGVTGSLLTILASQAQP